MGGLVPACEPVGAARIRQALQEQKKGSSSAFLKLQHCIARGTQAEVTELLIGLTHFAVSLTSEGRGAGANSLRQLMKTALDINFATCDSAGEGPEAMATLLDAYRLFVLNLVSANVTFVEPVLICFAKRAFVLSSDRREPVMECIHSMIPVILSMHPQATDVLARVINEKHPHQVRKGPELAAYMRSILELAVVCESETLRCAIIFTVVEKLLAIDALVPEVLTKPANHTEDDAMTDVENEHVQTTVRFCLDQDDVLCAEAEKMDLVLIEIFLYLKKACQISAASFSSMHVEPIYRAFERYVFPQHGARFVPYVLFVAASLAGTVVCQEVCERLRQSFFDASLHEESRSTYLRFSAVMIVRCNVLPARFCLRWMKSVAQWLNRYVDPFVENDCQSSATDVEVNTHMLFYTAVSCLLNAMTLRTDAFDTTLTRQKDSIAQMRLLRVLTSPLNPAFVIPSPIVNKFCAFALEIGGLDVQDVLRENELRCRLRKTHSQPRNALIECEDLAPLQLPQSATMVDSYYRKSNGDGTELDDAHSVASVLSAHLGSVLSASKIASTADETPMILSSS